MPACPDCGADIPDGENCHGKFEQLLAHEYAFPQAFGTVHHMTVAAYSLQHPRDYSRDALKLWRVILAESLDGLTTPTQFLERARAQFSGGLRVREKGALPPPEWPHAWPVTVLDVLVPPGEVPDAEGHIVRVKRWAASIRETLDAVIVGTLD
jgi:hypothetical protein